MDFNQKKTGAKSLSFEQEEYFLAEHNFWLLDMSSWQNIIFFMDFFRSGKVPGRSIIFRLVGRTNVTPQARGINQTGLHKFQTEEKQTRENLSGEKTIWKKYFQKNIWKKYFLPHFPCPSVLLLGRRRALK